MLRRMLSNERGLTLIELLVVVVILGIIVAIAIPAVGNIIDNSKRDAHIANAQQMVGAAKLFIASSGKSYATGTAHNITLTELINAGYMSQVKDPSGDATNRNYNPDNSIVIYTITAGTGGNPDTHAYTVTLVGSNGTTYFTAQDPNNLTRTGVTLP